MTIKGEKKPLYLLQMLQNKKLKFEVEAAKPLTHKTLAKIASEGRTETKPLCLQGGKGNPFPGHRQRSTADGVIVEAKSFYSGTSVRNYLGPQTLHQYTMQGQSQLELGEGQETHPKATTDTRLDWLKKRNTEKALPPAKGLSKTEAGSRQQRKSPAPTTSPAVNNKQ